MSKATEVQKTENALPMVIDYGEDASAGLEDMGKDEVKIPLLRILQSNSPQCKPPSAGGIEGAMQSMIFNTATSEMWDGAKGIGFIPVFRAHNFVEYIPRDAGGGFVGMYEENDPLIAKLRAEQGRFGKIINGGNEIAETYYLFGLALLEDQSVLQAVVPFVSTQIPKYQSFFTRYMGITYPNAKGDRVRPPLWAHHWRLGTVHQKSKKGEFYGWTLKLQEEPPVKSRMRLDDPLYIQGRAFYDLLKEGKAKVEHAADAKAGGGSGEPGADEIPF